jgi:hypothetical protein
VIHAHAHRGGALLGMREFAAQASQADLQMAKPVNDLIQLALDALLTRLESL